MADPNDNHERAFMFVAPFNIPLCLLVLTVCTIVLTYYWRNRGTLTNTLFIMITAADLITCVGHLILMICVLLMSRDFMPPVSVTVCVVMHTVLSLLGYASSVHFNMVLAVLRTIKVSFPFHQVSTTALKVATTLVIALLVSLTVVDVWYEIYAGPDSDPHPWVFLWVNVAISFVGHNMSIWLAALDLLIPIKVYWTIPDLLVGLLYLVPICVVLVCLVIQWLVTRDPDHPQLTDWSHVNTTVSILSAAFLVCNSGIAVLQL